MFQILKLQIKIGKIFSKNFVNTVKNLGILAEKESATFTENSFSEVEMALKKIQKPPQYKCFSHPQFEVQQ